MSIHSFLGVTTIIAAFVNYLVNVFVDILGILAYQYLSHLSIKSSESRNKTISHTQQGPQVNTPRWNAMQYDHLSRKTHWQDWENIYLHPLNFIDVIKCYSIIFTLTFQYLTNLNRGSTLSRNDTKIQLQSFDRVKSSTDKYRKWMGDFVGRYVNWDLLDNALHSVMDDN